MSDAAPAPAPVAAAPKPKAAKASKPKKPVNHPAFNVMIVEAIAALKERTGSSLPAIKKVSQCLNSLKGPRLLPVLLQHSTACLR